MTFALTSKLREENNTKKHMKSFPLMKEELPSFCNAQYSASAVLK